MNQRYGSVTYSQHGEDLLIVDIFDQLGIVHPSYLDIGAHHPFNDSNTALLYSRGSRGTLVEANPNLIPDLQSFRPGDQVIQSAVLPEAECGEESHEFYMFDDTSGLNTFSMPDANKLNSPYKAGMMLKARSINSFANLQLAPDFLSIDIEGYDYGVLEDMTFAPMVICAEVRKEMSGAFADMMGEKGYIPYIRMAENVIYLREDIYSQMMRNRDGGEIFSDIIG